MSLTLVLSLLFISLISNIYLFSLLCESKLNNEKLNIELERKKIVNRVLGSENIERDRIIDSINEWLGNQPAIIRNSLLNAVHNKKTNADNVVNISDYQLNKK